MQINLRNNNSINIKKDNTIKLLRNIFRVRLEIEGGRDNHIILGGYFDWRDAKD